MRLGPDAGKHHDLRCGDRARANDDLVSANPLDLAVALHLHAHGPSLLEQNTVGRAVGQDAQIGPAARRRQVGQGRALAHTVNRIQRKRANAGRVRPICVGAFGKAGRATSLHPGRLVRPPRVLGIAAHPDRAVVTVKVGRPEVEVVLHLAIVGQDLVESPAVVAHRRPRLEILRHAAQKDLGVDRARAAHDPAPRHRHPPALRGRLPDISPVVARRNDARGRREAQPDVSWQFVS